MSAFNRFNASSFRRARRTLGDDKFAIGDKVFVGVFSEHQGQAEYDDAGLVIQISGSIVSPIGQFLKCKPKAKIEREYQNKLLKIDGRTYKIAVVHVDDISVTFDLATRPNSL